MTSSDSWTARPPINSRLTAAEAVLADLRAAIEKGDLAVGVRLPSEAAMATRYQVSRSVVREALRSAETLGLTRTQTGRGTFVVSDRPAHDLRIGQFSSRDLVEARPHFEVPAAGLAAARRTEEHLIEIRGALFDPDVDDFDTKMAAHAAFHTAVAKATDNPLFELVVRPLYHAQYGPDVTGNLPPDYWTRIDADHRAMIDCIMAGDVESARRTASNHLDYVGSSTRERQIIPQYGG